MWIYRQDKPRQNVNSQARQAKTNCEFTSKTKYELNMNSQARKNVNSQACEFTGKCEFTGCKDQISIVLQSLKIICYYQLHATFIKGSRVYYETWHVVISQWLCLIWWFVEFLVLSFYMLQILFFQLKLVFERIDSNSS